MTKGRKPPSAPAKPKPAKPAAPAPSPAKSEQANEDGAQPDLSHPETEDSAALAAAAKAAAEGGGDDDGKTKGDEQPPEKPEKGEGEGDEPPEGEGDEEGAEKAPEMPKAVRDLQKRVGKLTEQRNEAREELAELKAQVEQLKAKGPGDDRAESEPPHPAESTFGSDRTVAEIDTDLRDIETFLAWADKNPQGGTFKAGQKTYELTEDDVIDNRRQGMSQRSRLDARRETRIEHLRQKFDEGREGSHAEALKLYPWIAKKDSAEFQEALAIIRQNPDLLKRVDFELVVARQVVGQRLETEAVKKKKPALPGQRPATPIVTHSPSAAPKPSGKADATVSAAEKQFREGGGRESDLSNLLAQRRLARLEAAKAG